MKNESLLPEEEMWNIAHSIAKKLTNHQQKIDPKKDGIRTELNKINSYLRYTILQNQENLNTTSSFFEYLDALVKNGRSVGHTGNTPAYYRCIQEVCNQHLKDFQSDALTMLQTLGWSIRLMYYYKVAPTGEGVSAQTVEVTVIAERQAAVEKLKTTQVLEVGQVIDAEVVKKNPKGSKVTYLLAGFSSTEKEPKTFDLIPETGIVKVQIVSLKEDGSINHVKYVES